jgi:hypothetical protein
LQGPTRIDPGKKPHGGRLHIAFDARDLTGKKEAGIASELEGGPQDPGRIDKGVTMDRTPSDKPARSIRGSFGKPVLLPVSVGLEPHQVEASSCRFSDLIEPQRTAVPLFSDR